MIVDVRELPEMNAEMRQNTPAFRQVPKHISVRTGYLGEGGRPMVVLWDARGEGRHVDILLKHCRKETIKIALRQLRRSYRQ